MPENFKDPYLPPKSNEEEYFARKEAVRGRELAEERLALRSAEERDMERQLHFMKCPKCGMQLEEITCGEIRIDKCQSCEGFWLDRGELELIPHKQGSFLEGLMNTFR